MERVKSITFAIPTQRFFPIRVWYVLQLAKSIAVGPEFYALIVLEFKIITQRCSNVNFNQKPARVNLLYYF